MGQGINILNNLMKRRSINPFGKVGSKAVVQVGSKLATFLFSTPVGWATIGIVVVVFFTFVIIFSLGAPPMVTAPQTIKPTPTINITPTVAPTETVTPTPVVL